MYLRPSRKVCALRGIDVLTCYEDGTTELEDGPLLQRAFELDRVLFSQDADLLGVAKEWQEGGRDFAGLVYGHQLQLTIGQAVRDLERTVRLLDPDETGIDAMLEDENPPIVMDRQHASRPSPAQRDFGGSLG